jgi:hypothetical protein
MIVFQVINQVIKPICMFNKNMGLDKIINQSKVSSTITMLTVIWIAWWSLDANSLNCSHVASVKGCECWTCRANTYHHTTYITDIPYTHKHITWTRTYTNTHVPQLKMSQEIFTIIELMMQTHIVKPNPLHLKNPSQC